jgi:hypothetical protein
VIVVGLAGIAGGAGRATNLSTGTPTASDDPEVHSRSGTSSSLEPGLVPHAPATVVAPGSPIQEQYDQAFSQGLGSLPGMDAAETLTVPAPAVTGGWPNLRVEITPERWAEVFAAALLDVDYARQSRQTLAAWLQAQEAPELIPGVPAAVADKVLYISLLDPGLFGGQPTPVVSASQWLAEATSRVSQTVSHVVVQPDPGWAQMTASGWQPADIRMTEEDVSGVLTVRGARAVASHRFGLQVIVGSARWHDGYGTVAVAGWEEQ